MSFLITGANGLIGRDFIKILSKNYKVVAIYRKKKINKLLNKNIKWIKHDLKKKILWKLKFTPRYIINCVIDQKFKDINSKKYFTENIMITNNLINYAKKNKVDLIVNLSSVDIYGKPIKGIVKESTKPINQSKYAKLKSLIEKLIIDSKLNFLNLRLPGTLCVDSINNPKRPWINTLINKMVKNEKVVIYNTEHKFNNLTSSHEILKFIKHSIKNNIYNKTYNFATKSPLTIDELIRFLKLNLKSKSNIKKSKSIKKNSFYISIDKLEKDTSFKTLSTKKIILNYISKLNNL